jgi:hypothetical protein
MLPVLRCLRSLADPIALALSSYFGERLHGFPSDKDEYEDGCDVINPPNAEEIVDK